MITVVVNSQVARQGVDAGVLDLTPDGYRFTDPARADIELQVIHEDNRADWGAWDAEALTKLAEWRPPDG